MNNSSAIATRRSNSRLVFLALLAVCVAPLLLAWLFARGPLNWTPQNNLNYGVLLQPPPHLNAFGVMDADGEALQLNAIARDWHVVVLSTTACQQACQQLLEAAKRIQLATGRDAYRVSLALLSPAEEVTIPRELNWRLPAQEEKIQQLRQALGNPDSDATLLIVDYQGYAILSYPSTEEGLGVLEDLKRLLKSAAS